ncbi:MAG: carbon starvation protein A [Acidobacteriota bacterium]|jgi:carbon starvation protein
MSVILPTLLCFAAYALAYRFYALFLSRRIFELRPEVPTPAHALEDGVDYVPTRRPVVFGHHFASITGLAPMLGPAVAVIWGWLPAMLWVVCGAVLVGCVHDFSALVVSLRGRGMSIGKVAEGIIGPRAKVLFLLVIFFGVGLAMGVFVFVIARLFSLQIDAATPGYPSAVTPSAGLMFVAVAVGYGLYRKGLPLAPLATAGFLVGLVLIWVGYLFPTAGLPAAAWPAGATWIAILLGYAFLASVLPVWVLLQARDFINSLLLYLGLIAAYVGLFVVAPSFQAPPVRTEVAGAPSMLPFVFIIIACGAASGFHGLVASGTTAKQLDRETDARPVAYGGMVAESLLALLAVVATTAGFSSADAWKTRYADWGSAQDLAGNLSAFIGGTARFIEGLGVNHGLAAAFVAVVVVSFALTTLDSATRLLRYNVEELAATVGLRLNRYASSVAAVGVIALFAFYKVDGQPAALALWTLFGTTNQLLAGLTLLAVTVYLRQRGKPVLFTGLPALFMLGSTLTAMTSNLWTFAGGEQIRWLLLVVGGILWVLGVWIVLEGVLALLQVRRAAGPEIPIRP